MNTKNDRIYNRTYKIAGGPNRDRLFDAIKYAYDVDTKVPINFQVVYGTTMPTTHPGCANIYLQMRNICVVSIQHECGSGYSFNIEGYLKTRLDNPHEILESEMRDYRFKAYYNADTREGVMSFEIRS